MPTMLLLAQTATALSDTAAGGATSSSSSAAEYVVYEISRLRAYDDERLPLALISAAVIALVGIVWYLYHRDTIELSRSRRSGILLLRFIALVGLLVFFLGVERRIDRKVVHNSQVPVLVDTSQSMGLPDGDLSTGTNSPRLEAVSNVLGTSPILEDLRRNHDVHIARFERDVEPLISFPKTEPEALSPEDIAAHTGSKESQHSPSDTAKWLDNLQPRGSETRLGQALADELRLYHGSPLAGIVVISDGAQNAGIEPGTAIEAAKLAKVPLYTIGVGSTAQAKNIAIRDMLVPTRAFPHDTLNITGYIQATGYAGRTIDVDLTRRRSQDKGAVASVIASQHVTLGPDGEMKPISFD